MSTLKVAHTENPQANQTKMILFAWHWIVNRNMTLLSIKSRTSWAPQSYNKLESDLAITKAVNGSFRNQILILERQCWSNAQNCRLENLEISGIPENIDDGEVEGKVLTVLSKLDVNINPANVEAYHCLESDNKGKRQFWNFLDERIRMGFVG